MNWSFYYDDFKDWLKTVKPLKWNKDNLSLNTQNKIIKSLNRFLDMVGKANQKQIEKCPQYSRSELTRVSAKDILNDDEIEKIQNELKQMRPASYNLFTVLVRTGMRENEALGLCLAFVVEGKLQGKKSQKMHELLEQTELGGDYHGYIVLESQPACKPFRIDKPFKDRFGETWKTNSVPRKPLKLRNSISAEHYRIIPVYDKEAWNIIAKLWNEQNDLLTERKFGNEPRDYLLFDGLTVSMFYGDVVKAFEKAKLPFRSPHKLRHAFLTAFYAATNESRFLARKVAGHNEERSMAIYSHIGEQIALEQTQKKQSQKKMKIV